jgi:hypothetical protein
MHTITEKQAYAAMFYFIEQLYKHTKSDELGGLLSNMAILEDGSPADPAIIREWQEAVQYALKGGEAGSLTLR